MSISFISMMTGDYSNINLWKRGSRGMYYIRRDNIGDICYDNYFVRCNVDKMNENNVPYRLVDLRKDDTQLLHAPLTITANVTDVCNLSCGFCFYPCKHLGRVMNRTTMDNILQYIETHFVYELDILGGEPLCDEAIDNTLYLINGALSIGCVQKIYVSSNGFYPHNIKRLQECMNSKIALSISVQFGCWRTYNSPEVQETLACLERSGVDYVISTVVDNITMQSKNEIASFIKDLRYCKSLLMHYPNIFKSNEDFLRLTPSIDDFWSFRSDLQQLLNIPISYDMPYAFHMTNSSKASNQFELIFCSCSGEYRKMEVMPDGTAVPCALLINHDKYRIGNINDVDFKYTPLLKRAAHSCNNTDCSFHGTCKVCHAYINDWGEDTRCPSYLNTSTN